MGLEDSKSGRGLGAPLGATADMKPCLKQQLGQSSASLGVVRSWLIEQNPRTHAQLLCAAKPCRVGSRDPFQFLCARFAGWSAVCSAPGQPWLHVLSSASGGLRHMDGQLLLLPKHVPWDPRGLKC